MSIFFTKESIVLASQSMDRSIPLSDVDGEMIHVEVVNSLDWISKLPNDLLLKVLSKLSMEEVLRTSVLSKRWVDVWKETSHLYLDMRRIAKAKILLPEVSHQAARSVTKIIKDHRGHLERCTIYHDSLQCEDGVFESWIQSLVNVKHIKHLKLVNLFDHFEPITGSHVTLDLLPKSFSHPDLISLFLDEYNLETPHAFYSCRSLKDLSLINVSAETEVFNAVLVSCPSLEVLALKISCHKKGFLKIENHNLKFLFLSCLGIKGINVSSPNLDILSIEYLSCKEENFFTASPRLHSHRNYWAAGQCLAHTSYIISCPQQGEESIGHKVMLSGFTDCMKMLSLMSVSVDLTNAKEVEMLRQVLAAWPVEMGELEIVSKSNNDAIKESESSIGKTRNTIWEETKPFPNAEFRVYTVWLSNFSGSEEEFALASRVITHGTVIWNMKIRPSSSSTTKKSKIKAAIAKLKELPKCHNYFRITCSDEALVEPSLW
ncbi:hypothetical protein BRARA_B02316 [Brassica rapa]|uniref:F-box domain-containing protein n=4 Tax=Brassica TaxID=3705 RepID=A0ABQ7X110_BRANA|nr:putative F-box protein At1g67390 [Brassica rapa]XP_013741360.2 putative F-box protein At1g67390 [Brassica napus]KAH0849587.1 hypothetical protein HID58_096257 [Brassica napus]RID75263.1 hypothetical protein BRARA_B02316 [Brassica rapa]CAG7893831.1 unnamed protein product [Brassica rapa]VDC89247.1 unnamed protein product [Brassica rapa]